MGTDSVEASGRTLAMPSASAAHTAAADSDPLNLSGASRTVVMKYGVLATHGLSRPA